jgi:archaeosine synthase beta-subunit
MQAIDTLMIKSRRPERNRVDPLRPHAYLIEPEHTRWGVAEDVATLFLVNSECPFTCVFCDLWKNTLSEPTPLGAIPAQIDFAFERLGLRSWPSGSGDRPSPRHIKLYNSGNFFDPRAVPRQDYEAIAARVRGFQTVIVENHPRLCGDDCVRFRDLVAPARLEVAMGLETIHPEILPRLNKQMTLDDFSTAATFLRREEIDIRAFILLRPPWLTEEEGLHWALRSIEFAFNHGAGCCSVIPVRSGNGMMESLREQGESAPPRLSTLESVLNEGLAMGRGRVFADLWDAARFAHCPACAEARITRMAKMNLAQRPFPPIECALCPRESKA